MVSNSRHLTELVVVRRLLILSQQEQDKRNGKRVRVKTAQEAMEEDRALLGQGTAPEGQAGKSGETPAAAKLQPQPAAQPAAKPAAQKPAPPAEQPAAQVVITPATRQMEGKQTVQVQVAAQQVVTREASLELRALPRVDGLVRRSNMLAETDRYRFDFTDGTTFTVTDKWSNRSTTIWGDPHVDVDDIQGTYNGDFKDLTGSNSHTTFMLQDGTRLTFTAQDEGVIESVDIFYSGQHLQGIGQASKKWTDTGGLFSGAVDRKASQLSSLPQGDVVYAGGDGNDWYDSGGKLLWGETTGPVVTSRPSAVLQMQYKETVSQQVAIQVNRQG
jgi:hypothetical protein